MVALHMLLIFALHHSSHYNVSQRWPYFRFLMMQKMEKMLVKVCWCFKIAPLLELLILTIKKAEPIVFKRVYLVSSTTHFRQAMGVTVMFLVKMWKFMGKPWLSEYLLIIMTMVFLKWKCMCSHCREKHGKTMPNWLQVTGHCMLSLGIALSLAEIRCLLGILGKMEETDRHICLSFQDTDSGMK